jgi:hypothetical protein
MQIIRALLQVVLVFSILTVVSCRTPAILQAPTGPGTQFPCGFYEHPCVDKTCCGNDEACGGGSFSGCPTGACCAADSGKRLHAARPIEKAKPE